MLTGRDLVWNDWRLTQSKIPYMGSVRVFKTLPPFRAEKGGNTNGPMGVVSGLSVIPTIIVTLIKNRQLSAKEHADKIQRIQKKNVKTEWKDDGIRERTKWLQIPLKQKKGNDKCSISTKKRRERKKIMQHDIAKKTGIKESTHNEPLRLLTGDEINLLSRGLNYIPTPVTYGSHIRKALITSCGQEGKSISNREDLF